jgi:hypothetical protein
MMMNKTNKPNIKYNYSGSMFDGETWPARMQFEFIQSRK